MNNPRSLPGHTVASEDEEAEDDTGQDQNGLDTPTSFRRRNLQSVPGLDYIPLDKYGMPLGTSTKVAMLFSFLFSFSLALVDPFPSYA
jgi:hypothetical protein